MSLSISLIGMAGSGKSTIGNLLATKLNKLFIDTDKLIEEKMQLSLQEILDKHGYLKLRKIEASVLKKLTIKNSIVATGGSAVYSIEAMKHLSKHSLVIYLDVPLSIILNRVGYFENRGFAADPEHSLDRVFKERAILYEKFSDIIIDNSLSVENCLKKIARALPKNI